QTPNPKPQTPNPKPQTPFAITVMLIRSGQNISELSVPRRNVGKLTKEKPNSKSTPQKDDRTKSIESLLQHEILKREETEARVKALESLVERLPVALKQMEFDQGEHTNSVRVRKLVNNSALKQRFEDEFTQRETKIGVN